LNRLELVNRQIERYRATLSAAVKRTGTSCRLRHLRPAAVKRPTTALLDTWNATRASACDAGHGSANWAVKPYRYRPMDRMERARMVGQVTVCSSLIVLTRLPNAPPPPQSMRIGVANPVQAALRSDSPSDPAKSPLDLPLAPHPRCPQTPHAQPRCLHSLAGSINIATSAALALRQQRQRSQAGPFYSTEPARPGSSSQIWSSSAVPIRPEPDGDGVPLEQQRENAHDLYELVRLTGVACADERTGRQMNTPGWQ
jgi:hypothetical protein